MTLACDPVVISIASIMWTLTTLAAGFFLGRYRERRWWNGVLNLRR